VVRGPLDEQVRARFIAETGGTPLVLLELSRDLTGAGVAAGFGGPAAPGLPGRLEGSFRRRLRGLPPDTRRLVVVAAAEPAGDPVLVWRAAGRLQIGMDAAAPGGGGRVAGDRRAGDLPASAGPVGGVPGGVRGGPAGRAPGAGRGHRPAGRPRPPGVAPGAGGRRAR
jgi:hypothetical protein